MLKHLIIAVSMSTLVAGGVLAADKPSAGQPAEQLQSAPPSQASTEAQPATRSQAESAPQAAQAAPGMAASTPQAEVQAQARKNGVETADTCLSAAMTLARIAEDKQFADDRLDKIEQMLSKMEDHCDAQQFSEAQATAKDIEKAINAQ
jgi:ribosome assembly protein YihI (activator of Der GTPase)